jgi:hypothetical protein
MLDLTIEKIEDIDIIDSSKRNLVDISYINTDIIKRYINYIDNINEKEDLIEKTILFLKKNFCLDAVGLRLREGSDYPYYTTLGFSDAFVKAENYLCKRDENGNILRDENGEPILECLCGNIINKKIDKSSCITERGSFLTINGIKSIQKVPSAINCSTRNKCFEEGYKTVAIIPVSYKDSIIGLLQMNHKQKNAFGYGLIETAEEIAAMMGQTLGGIIKTEQERAAKKEALAKNIRKMVLELQSISRDIVKKYE